MRLISPLIAWRLRRSVAALVSSLVRAGRYVLAFALAIVAAVLSGAAGLVLAPLALVAFFAWWVWPSAPSAE